MLRRKSILLLEIKKGKKSHRSSSDQEVLNYFFTVPH
jgi:hypothetical protein